MRDIPGSLRAYKRTPSFNQDSIPRGLRKAHQTKPGVWARIVVESGRLLYRRLEPTPREEALSPSVSGVVEPEQLHEVEPLGDVTFHVEFYRAQDS